MGELSMNGVTEEYKLELTQSSKGVWYTQKLMVISDNPSDLVTKADHLMKQVEDTLDHHNNPEKYEKKEEGD
jgi:hypothetical protein